MYLLLENLPSFYLIKLLTFMLNTFHCFELSYIEFCSFLFIFRSLFNVMSKSVPVKVAVRCRPLNSKEADQPECLQFINEANQVGKQHFVIFSKY